MTYKLTFLETALKEWDKLDNSLKDQFKTVLKRRLENPYIIKDALYTMQNCYKIKLRQAGYRLVYQVIENRLVVQVVAVGKRDKFSAYIKANERIAH